MGAWMQTFEKITSNGNHSQPSTSERSVVHEVNEVTLDDFDREPEASGAMYSSPFDKHWMPSTLPAPVNKVVEEPSLHNTALPAESSASEDLPGTVPEPL